MASIEFKGVTKRYGSTTAIENLSFRIEDGEAFCFFGPPLAGKTTLLRIILGLDTPDAGQVFIDDKPVIGVSAAERNIAMVFQNLALFPHMTALDNLRFPLVERGVQADAIAARVDAVANTLRITHILHKHPAQLSGGERQRVAIGRSLVRDPVAFLMDDPISALDARLREEMRVELKRIQQQLGKTLVYVTHDQEEAMSIADRLAILREGTIQQIGTPAEIYDQPKNDYVARMLGQPSLNLITVMPDPAGDGLVSPDRFFRFGKKPDQVRTIGIRPENVTLTDPATDASMPPARILTIEPLGGFTVVNVGAEGAEASYRVLMQGQPDIAVGQAAQLGFVPDTLLHFDAQGALIRLQGDTRMTSQGVLNTNDWRDRAHAVAAGIRRDVLDLTLQRDGCYLSQALSSAEVFATLYTKTLHLGPSEAPFDPPDFLGVPGSPGGFHFGAGGAYNGPRGGDYDRLIISPAHYAVAVYAVLVETGRLSPQALQTFNTDGSTVEMIGAEHSPGFELTTGSFGQAISQAGGIAMARRLKGDKGRVCVFMSDGELEEGQTWEGIQCLAHYRLDNVVVVVDVNGQQVDGYTKDVMNIEPISDRIEGFGARAIKIDGHDVEELDAAVNSAPDGRPLFVLAYTDSARGMPILEARKPLLHYVRARNNDEQAAFRQALANM